jgi:Protein of unknown function (DUF3606)
LVFHLFRLLDVRPELAISLGVVDHPGGMAKKAKTSRGRKQDRARVAGGQRHEVRYESKKTGRSAASVKKAVKRVGNSRRRVERRLEG